MLDLATRHLLPELMDQPGLAEHEHRRALVALARINRLSRSAEIFWPTIRRLAMKSPRPLRLLDVASGGGDVCLRLWCKARRQGIPLEIVGIDVSDVALRHARRQAKGAGAKIEFLHCDVLQDAFPVGFDVTISSLFLHHLEESRVVALLAKMRAVTSQALLINDLRRSYLGYALAQLACQLTTRSRIVHVDGPRSVAGAFTELELRQLFLRAGMPSVHVYRRWPFRMLAAWSATG